MKVDVLLPQRGMGMTEATIVEWLVVVGDSVKQGQPICQIESAKVTEELVSPSDGIVLEIKVDEGDIAEVGELIAIIGDNNPVSYNLDTREETSKSVEAGDKPQYFLMNNFRNVTAKRMMESLHTTAQLTMFAEAEVTDLVQEHVKLKSESDITYTDLIILAVSKALMVFPIMNTAWTEQGILKNEKINIGVAVAVEDGLVVPVIKEADRKNIHTIHKDLIELVEKARAGKLSNDELSGGTFTITNLGRSKVKFFTPILNPPQTAILGVGRIHEAPIIKNGQIMLGYMLGLSLTFDHRILDGEPAAEFLDFVCHQLECSFSD